MSLIDRMIGLKARLQGIPERMGVPQYRSLLIRHTILDDDLLPSHTDTLIQPKPWIQSVPTRLVGFEIAGASGGSISINADDYQVKEVPRSYAKDFFEKDVSLVVIDPALAIDPTTGAAEVLYNSQGEPAGGIYCKILTVRDDELLSWSLLLREYSDRVDLDNLSINW